MIYEIKKFNEAFRAGKAGTVANKILSIVSKRFNDKVSVAEVPFIYTNERGLYEGYLGYFSVNDLFVRINFLKSSSDVIESYDLYLDGLKQPTDNYPTIGLNVVEVVESIFNQLIELGVVLSHELSESTNFFERGRPTKNVEDYVYMIEKWVEDDDRMLDHLQRKSLSATFSKEWMAWVKDKPRYKEEVKYDMFIKMVKFFLLERGLTNKTFRKRRKGLKDRVAEDPILEAQLDAIVDEITSDEKFELLKGAIGQMVSGNLKSIFLLGSPGSGKSYETLQTLDKLNANYKVYKGGVKGTDELMRILYNNREDTILVFDDADSIRKNKDQNNILKAALDSTGERIITWVDTKRANNAGMNDVPQQFEFNSSIIFITNEPKVDPAIKSRAMPIMIDITNSDMVDRINSKLEAYRPDIDMKTKQMALDYAREVAQGVDTLDFRSLDLIIIAIQIGGNWKRNALLMLKS